MRNVEVFKPKGSSEVKCANFGKSHEFSICVKIVNIASNYLRKKYDGAEVMLIEKHFCIDCIAGS